MLANLVSPSIFWKHRKSNVSYSFIIVAVYTTYFSCDALTDCSVLILHYYIVQYSTVFSLKLKGFWWKAMKKYLVSRGDRAMKIMLFEYFCSTECNNATTNAISENAAGRLDESSAGKRRYRAAVTAVTTTADMGVPLYFIGDGFYLWSLDCTTNRHANSGKSSGSLWKLTAAPWRSWMMSTVPEICHPAI